jgi:outer membrane protein TolC
MTARDLSQKNVAAEQQKYTLGTVTVFELLQAQVQLSNAELTLLGAYTSYQEAQIAYQRATWTLLDKLGLKVNP